MARSPEGVKPKGLHLTRQDREGSSRSDGRRLQLGQGAGASLRSRKAINRVAESGSGDGDPRRCLSPRGTLRTLGETLGALLGGKPQEEEVPEEVQSMRDNVMRPASRSSGKGPMS